MSNLVNLIALSQGQLACRPTRPRGACDEPRDSDPFALVPAPPDLPLHLRRPEVPGRRSSRRAALSQPAGGRLRSAPVPPLSVLSPEVPHEATPPRRNLRQR